MPLSYVRTVQSRMYEYLLGMCIAQLVRAEQRKGEEEEEEEEEEELAPVRPYVRV